MKQRKKIRDGIGLYFPSEPKTHFSEKQNPLFLLAAVQLPAVWFLAFSWWKSLTSVLPIQTDTVRLYLFCFLFAGIFVFLWNTPQRAARKGIFLIVPFFLAVLFIRRHTDAAVNVLNVTANAYLTVCNPNAAPYPIQPVSEPEMALMFAVFLLPLLFIWSLILHIRKGTFFAFILLLSPAAFALIIAEVPSEMSCWLLLLSGAVYAAVCGCRQGRSALLKGLSAAGILTVLILLSASSSRPLEPYKQSSGGFYARTRESIETGWIKPLQDSFDQAKAERQTPQENEQPPANEPESDPVQAEQEPSPSEAVPEAEAPPDFSAEPSEDAADSPLFSTDDDTEQAGNSSGQQSAEISSGSADTFPKLDALSYFQPDKSTRLTLTFDSKPEETVYYPSAYGVFYKNSRWSEVSANSMEIYYQYPDNLDRLETLCEQNHPETLAAVSDFIQKQFEEHTVYDFEPGPTPDGKDFAEYFLFDNGRGFCVHFATTAVLMYRMCGFQARYVQGYAVSASAFHRQEDGRYAADVTGEMGHAWCEVYENEEWVIKEHTLSYHGARPHSGIPAASENGRSWVPNAVGWCLLILKICAIVFVCLLTIILLFFFQAALRRQHKYRHFRTVRSGAGIRRIYCAIYETALFQGMKKTDILSLHGFQMLCDFFPELPDDSIEWLYQTVLETMFYQKIVTKEETKQAWGLYRQFSLAIRKELSPFEKWIYQYIKVL